MHFILIMFMATGSSSQAGIGSVAVEFNNYESCRRAGQSLAQDAYEKKSYVLTWGCFSEGTD